MSQYYKNNKGKTLLDKVSVSEIAYSILVYESSYNVWMEDIKKSETCATTEEEKAFEHVTRIKYHVQRVAFLCIVMVGQVKVVHISIPFVVKFGIW